MGHNERPHRLAASGETAPTSLKPAGRLLSESSQRSYLFRCQTAARCAVSAGWVA